VGFIIDVNRVNVGVKDVTSVAIWSPYPFM
jgi:hypothetical protein